MRREMLGAEGPKSTRDSRNTQSLELSFCATLTEDVTRRIELARA